MACASVLLGTGCVSTPPDTSGRTNADGNLRQFALANCLFWYFDKQEWPTDDIRAISGGFVETGDDSPETYQRISEWVRDYQPDVSTKHPVDLDLLKCFLLDQSTELEALLSNP